MCNTALILAGGKGERLRSIISDRPKPLAPIGGKPFLFILLEELRQNQIREVLLLTGYLHQQIEEACGNGDKFGLKISYSREIKPAGTAGALAKAKDYLTGLHSFLLLNGDSYLANGIAEMQNQNSDSNDLGYIAATQIKNSARYGTLIVDQKTHHIKDFCEKQKKTKSLINAGIYKLKPSILKYINPNRPSSLELEIFPKIIQTEKNLKAIIINEKLFDIGTPEGYDQFNEHMAKKHGT